MINAKTRITIIRECCEWFAVNPTELTLFEMEERKAFSMICSLLTKQGQTVEELADYFNISVAKIREYLRQHNSFMGIQENYTFVYGKVKKQIEKLNQSNLS